MSLSKIKVHVESFTFGDKSKKYPYPMYREVDLREFIKKKLKWKKKFEKDYRGIAKQLFQKHNETMDILIKELSQTIPKKSEVGK